jgi:hypothetical protein
MEYHTVRSLGENDLNLYSNHFASLAPVAQLVEQLPFKEKVVGSFPTGRTAMKVFIICSKKFYAQVADVQKKLEAQGHVITLPNSYDDPTAEERYRNLGTANHSKWKAGMLQHSSTVISKNDAVLVLNFEKGGVQNYIGGATFIEMYDAFRLQKKIFLFNEIPEGILRDEIMGFTPTVINGDLRKVR